MNILLGEENVAQIDEKYTVLELDTIRISGQDIKAYCVVEQLPLYEMLTLEQFRDLHENLMKNYKSKNWKYCIDAIEHLKGKWKGDLDSFYDDLNSRILRYLQTDPGNEWDGVIVKT
jgi:hypothetical protein